MCVRNLDVGAEERPGTLRPLIRPVEPDVTSPDDTGSELDERWDETRRLRVVDEHDVAASNDAAQPLGIHRRDPVVVRPLGGTEGATVTRRAVEAVVDALRDREELGITRDHDPIHLDPEPARIPEQGRQHFRNPSALRGRVNAHDASAADTLPKLGGRRKKRRQALLANDRLQPARVERHDIHRIARCHAAKSGRSTMHDRRDVELQLRDPWLLTQGRLDVESIPLPRHGRAPSRRAGIDIPRRP